MQNTELEYKYQVSNLGEFETKIEKLGAKFEKEFHGVDSYFLMPDNPDGKKYLRVREKGNQFELCFHYVPNNLQSDEWEIKIDDPETAKEILRKIGHDDDVVVDKMRKVYQYKNSEIVLDEVKDLGSFIEIESPTETELIEIEKELELDESRRITDQGYPDMIRGYLIGQK